MNDLLTKLLDQIDKLLGYQTIIILQLNILLSVVGKEFLSGFGFGALMFVIWAIPIGIALTSKRS